MKDKALLLESLRRESHLLRAVWSWKIDLKRNEMIPELNQETGEISNALGGRHTTVMYRFMKSKAQDCGYTGIQQYWIL